MQRRSESLSTCPPEACGCRLNRASIGRCGSEEGSCSDDRLRVQRARSDSQVRKEQAEKKQRVPSRRGLLPLSRFSGALK
ncbi:hypothetical protein ABVT39_024231 [Epinephelus coioides]